MKNKPAVLFALGLIGFMVTAAYAAPGVRGAKGHRVFAVSSTGVVVSSGATTVYSVVTGTGAVTDFIVLFDSASTNGITSATQGSGGYRLRVYPTSATANTQVSFDPPIFFQNGLTVIPATAFGTAIVTYEPGRATQGY